MPSFRLQLQARTLWVIAWLALACIQASGQTKDASKHPHVLVVKALLATPESEIDFAKAKVTIDHLIDPKTDVEGTLAQLETMATDVRAMVSIRSTSNARAEALRAYLYDPGPWNRGRVFQYDFDDPPGTHIPNKLLATYLRTRKGNCVSMPFLYIALGQKLGLNVGAALAPNHVFVKFRDDRGNYVSVRPVPPCGVERVARRWRPP